MTIDGKMQYIPGCGLSGISNAHVAVSNAEETHATEILI